MSRAERDRRTDGSSGAQPRRLPRNRGRAAKGALDAAPRWYPWPIAAVLAILLSGWLSLTIAGCGDTGLVSPRLDPTKQARVTVVARCRLGTLTQTFVVVTGDTVRIACPCGER